MGTRRVGECPDQVLWFKEMIAEDLFDICTVICIHVYVVYTRMSDKTDGRKNIGSLFQNKENSVFIICSCTGALWKQWIFVVNNW
jgi:hypothetical protein